MINNKNIRLFFVIFFVAAILSKPRAVMRYVKNALSLCYNNVIPSLFLFMVIQAADGALIKKVDPFRRDRLGFRVRFLGKHNLWLLFLFLLFKKDRINFTADPLRPASFPSFGTHSCGVAPFARCIFGASQAG